MMLGGHLYVDMADDITDERIDALFDTIVKTIQPRFLCSRFAGNIQDSFTSRIPTAATSSTLSVDTRKLNSLSIGEVALLLENCSLSNYKDTFVSNEIDGATLCCAENTNATWRDESNRCVRPRVVCSACESPYL